VIVKWNLGQGLMLRYLTKKEIIDKPRVSRKVI